MDNREAAKKAKAIADEMTHGGRWSACDLSRYLNEQMEATFYSAGQRVYMQQEPDHLPAVHIVTCG